MKMTEENLTPVLVELPTPTSHAKEFPGHRVTLKLPTLWNVTGHGKTEMTGYHKPEMTGYHKPTSKSCVLSTSAYFFARGSFLAGQIYLDLTRAISRRWLYYSPADYHLAGGKRRQRKVTRNRRNGRDQDLRGKKKEHPSRSRDLRQWRNNLSAHVAAVPSLDQKKKKQRKKNRADGRKGREKRYSPVSLFSTSILP